MPNYLDEDTNFQITQHSLSRVLFFTFGSFLWFRTSSVEHKNKMYVEVAKLLMSAEASMTAQADWGVCLVMSATDCSWMSIYAYMRVARYIGSLICKSKTFSIHPWRVTWYFLLFFPTSFIVAGLTYNLNLNSSRTRMCALATFSNFYLHACNATPAALELERQTAYITWPLDIEIKPVNGLKLFKLHKHLTLMKN